MQNNYRSKAFKAWLDKLQQESWQLELIISGFAIYGLTQVIQPLETSYNVAKNNGNTIFIISSSVAIYACLILLTTLLFHVILRGLWIGALGLRYVSGDIDYKKLNYRPKFDNYLRKKIGSFDKYISKLEDYCSVLFAVSFLLVFYLISFLLYAGILVLIAYFFIKDHDIRPEIYFVTGVFLMIFTILGMILTFLDFITLGYLKKNKWLAQVYFPFYWLFSYLTLSFLYRALVHNFLDNKFGKQISFILIPSYFLLSTILAFSFNRSNYFSASEDSNSFSANLLNYDENIKKEDLFIDKASIPSKIITTHYLPIFIEYNESIEDAVFTFNKILKPKEDIRGYKSDFMTGYNRNIKKTDSLKLEYVKTVSRIYSFKIDTVNYISPDFIYTKHNQNQNGFETVLSLKNIKEGKHDLSIYRLSKTDSTQTQDTIITIPFWYYKN